MAYGMGFLSEIMPLLQIIRGEVGLAEANAGNKKQYDIGAGLIGFDPETGARTPNSGIFKELRDMLREEGAYGSDIMGGLRDANQTLLRGDMKNLAQRFKSVLGGYDTLGGELGQGFDTLAERTRTGYGALGEDLSAGYSGLAGDAARGGGGVLSDIRSGYGKLGAGYGQRETDVMSLLEGMGATERADIEEAMSNTAAANQAALRAKGIGSSSLIGNQSTADARAKAREFGALEERLRTQKGGMLASLRGDTLSAEERGVGSAAAQANANIDRLSTLGLAGMGARERVGAESLASGERLGAEGLASRERLGSQRLSTENLQAGQESDLRRNAAQQYTADEQNRINYVLNNMAQMRGLKGDQGNAILGWLQQLQHQAPNIDNAWSSAMAMMAANNAPTPEQPNFFEAMAPGLGTGIGTAAGFGLLGGAGSLFSTMGTQAAVRGAARGGLNAGLTGLTRIGNYF